MLERHFRHLPVVDNAGKLLGMLSIRNLLEQRIDDLSHELDALEQYVTNDGPGRLSWDETIVCGWRRPSTDAWGTAFTIAVLFCIVVSTSAISQTTQAPPAHVSQFPFLPSRALSSLNHSPRACALGCILTPLCGSQG